jgi:hypothetical protein
MDICHNLTLTKDSDYLSQKNKIGPWPPGKLIPDFT